MSDCVYSDPKLKKTHYHLHYKNDSEQNGQGHSQLHQSSIRKGSNDVNVVHQTSFQNQQGQSQRAFNTGFISVDTTHIETIDINQKLLSERDALRVRVVELQQSLMVALEQQKTEILKQCEQQYSEQLSSIEAQHRKEIQYEKDQIPPLKQQIVELTARISTQEQNILSHQATIENYEKRYEKQSEKHKKEKELLKRDLKDQIERSNLEIQNLKDKMRDNSSNTERQNKIFFEEQINNLKSHATWKDSRIVKLEQENQQLEQQMHQKQFDIFSLQNQMKIQMSTFDKMSVQRQSSDADKYVSELKRQYEQTISRLEEKLIRQKDKTNKYKILSQKQPLKLDPIIVERPVLVETVLENVKYVPIERVVKQSGGSNSNGVLLSQHEKQTEKESELVKHYEDIIEQQSYKLDTMQRKLNTFTQIHNLQRDQQNVQEQQNLQLNDAIRKHQQESEYLKQSLQNYEQNIKSIANQFDSSN